MNGQIKDGLFHFQKKGRNSQKTRKKINKKKLFENVKKSKFYNKFLENILPDAKLIDIKKKEKKDD